LLGLGDTGDWFRERLLEFTSFPEAPSSRRYEHMAERNPGLDHAVFLRHVLLNPFSVRCPQIKSLEFKDV
jgi:hypothetical protein